MVQTNEYFVKPDELKTIAEVTDAKAEDTNHVPVTTIVDYCDVVRRAEEVIAAAKELKEEGWHCRWAQRTLEQKLAAWERFANGQQN